MYVLRRPKTTRIIIADSKFNKYCSLVVEKIGRGRASGHFGAGSAHQAGGRNW
jgi:hypothetical protein